MMTEDKKDKYKPGDVIDLEENAPGFCDKETHFKWVDQEGKELPSGKNKDLKDIDILRKKQK